MKYYSQEVLKARLEAKYIPEPNSGCWLWLAAERHGYGLIAIGPKKQAGAHRVSYELVHGKIPAGLQIDHKCRNTFCVNPDHLEPVTAKENILRSPFCWGGKFSRKTHCPQGHEYNKENTYDAVGKRSCKICGREYDRRRGWPRKGNVK